MGIYSDFVADHYQTHPHKSALDFPCDHIGTLSPERANRDTEKKANQTDQDNPARAWLYEPVFHLFESYILLPYYFLSSLDSCPICSPQIKEHRRGRVDRERKSTLGFYPRAQ